MRGNQDFRLFLYLLAAEILPQAALSYSGSTSAALVFTAALVGAYLVFASRYPIRSVVSLLSLTSIACATLQLRFPARLPADLPLHWSGNFAVTTDPRSSRPGEIRFFAEILPERAKVQLSASDLPWGASTKLAAGSIMSGEIKFKSAAELSPDPFSYQGYLYRRGCLLSGRLMRFQIVNEVLPRPGLRDRLAESILAALPESRGIDVTLAAVLGLRELLGPELDLLFKRTGTSHLIVVSGFHIGALFFFFFWLTMKTLGRSERFVTVFPAEQAGALAGLGAAFGYTLLIGFEFSLIRALLVLLIFSLGRILSRRTSSVRTLLIVLILSFIIWPASFFEVSCELTFLSILGLIVGERIGSAVGANSLPPIRRRLSRDFCCCCGAFAFTSPVLLFWFGTFVPLAPLINMLAIPIFSAVSLLGGGAATALFSIAPSLGTPLLRCIGAVTDKLLLGLEALNRGLEMLGAGCLEFETGPARLTALGVSALLVLACAAAFSFDSEGSGTSEKSLKNEAGASSFNRPIRVGRSS